MLLHWRASPDGGGDAPGGAHELCDLGNVDVVEAMGARETSHSCRRRRIDMALYVVGLLKSPRRAQVQRFMEYDLAHRHRVAAHAARFATSAPQRTLSCTDTKSVMLSCGMLKSRTSSPSRAP
jgi:hypothetical protein